MKNMITTANYPAETTVLCAGKEARSPDLGFVWNAFVDTGNPRCLPRGTGLGEAFLDAASSAGRNKPNFAIIGHPAVDEHLQPQWCRVGECRPTWTMSGIRSSTRAFRGASQVVLV